LYDYLGHRRIILFWTVAIAGLLGPWLVRALDSSADRADQTDLRSCEVASVHDGDTVRVRCEGRRLKIRLYCIDTPEIAQRPWGIESRNVLRAMIRDAGGRVTVREHGKDRYGRVIGELIAGDHVLNVGLVRGGFAAVYTKYCPRRATQYWAAERQAKSARVGIWSKPGLHQRPWEYRARRR
jgi:endonuclease YncB( thermonuclease family)